MRSVLLAGAVAFGCAAACSVANATPIASGGSVAAAPIVSTNMGVLASFVGVPFTSQAPAGQASTFNGTYTTAVYKDSSNNLCGVAGSCLSFAIQVTNSASSADGIETVTTGPFSNGFTYNVGYVAVQNGIVPLTITDSVYGAVAFNFTTQGNVSNLIMPGKTSDPLVIQTSATNYRAGSISFQDSQTATVAGFLPAAAAIPEPASLALLGMGVGLAGFVTERRRRAV